MNFFWDDILEIPHKTFWSGAPPPPTDFSVRFAWETWQKWGLGWGTNFFFHLGKKLGQKFSPNFGRFLETRFGEEIARIRPKFRLVQNVTELLPIMGTPRWFGRTPVSPEIPMQV